jgi:hypothetical protein
MTQRNKRSRTAFSSVHATSSVRRRMNEAKCAPGNGVFYTRKRRYAVGTASATISSRVLCTGKKKALRCRSALKVLAIPRAVLEPESW